MAVACDFAGGECFDPIGSTTAGTDTSTSDDSDEQCAAGGIAVALIAAAALPGPECRRTVSPARCDSRLGQCGPAAEQGVEGCRPLGAFVVLLGVHLPHREQTNRTARPL